MSMLRRSIHTMVWVGRVGSHSRSWSTHIMASWNTHDGHVHMRSSWNENGTFYLSRSWAHGNAESAAWSLGNSVGVSRNPRSGT